MRPRFSGYVFCVSGMYMNCPSSEILRQEAA
jgi:hypothetical protein